MKKQMKTLFGGTVQGVGFRFTAERIAKQFEVTGYVRNLPDGRVELVAEGEEETVKDFLEAVKESQVAQYVRDVKTAWSDASGKYQNFGVTY